MYCIPLPDKWTIIINKETDTWGSFKYDLSKDVVRVDVPVQKQTEKQHEIKKRKRQGQNNDMLLCILFVLVVLIF